MKSQGVKPMPSGRGAVTNPTIPHGTMTVAKARKKWEALYKAAQDGTDPARTFDAVQDFAGVAEAMFIEWSKT